LLLDIDPDQSLGTMLGVDLESDQDKTEAGADSPLKTLSDLTSRIEDEDAFAELGGSPATVKIPWLLQWYTQFQSERFDLISLGPKWTAGDYRSANFLFEFIIPAVGERYANIVVDSPAGLEHLNRKVVARLDDLFIVLDPSRKSLVHVERVKRITREVGISYRRLFLVGNYEFDAEAEETLTASGESYLGKVDFDPALKRRNLRGESLLELPDDSPACASIRGIIASAGYEVA
jgi:CO dehydrogenase maturation factor